MNNTLVISALEYAELVKAKATLEIVRKVVGSNLYNTDEVLRVLVQEISKREVANERL